MEQLGDLSESAATTSVIVGFLTIFNLFVFFTVIAVFNKAMSAVTQARQIENSMVEAFAVLAAANVEKNNQSPLSAQRRKAQFHQVAKRGRHSLPGKRARMRR